LGDFLALGVEVNRYWEKSPEGFDDFLSVYSKTYDEIKQVSPDTNVFSIFQFEYMKGLSGHEEHTALIGRFGNKLDLVGITTYPFLEFESPEQIPDDYFFVTQQILITETGWPSQPVADIIGSEETQEQYVKKLFEILPDNTKGVIWSFPHDIGIEYPPFEHVSLKTSDGEEKMAYAMWRTSSRSTP